MGGIASLVGIGSGPGAQGASWSAGSTEIAKPVSTQQAQTAYDQSQKGIQQQLAFLQALQAQGGVQNQSDVYKQLSQIASGQGPNPAAAMLNNATGANTANQAALMAGQRGAGSNVGLIARQAAQQGAANQQNAVGQAAALQAQQSLGALNTQGSLANQQVAQQAAATGAYTGATQSEQQNLLNQISAQNNASVALQNGQNQANQQQAAQGAKGQAGILGGISMAAGLAHGGMVQGYSEGTPNAPIQPPSSAMPSGAPMGPPQPKSFVGRAAKGISDNFASGSNGQDDQITKSMSNTGAAIGKGLRSLFGSGDLNYNNSEQQTQIANNNAALMSQPDGAVDLSNFADGGEVDMMAKLAPMIAMMASRGGKVPAMVSPGEIYLPPDKAKKVAEGKADPKQVGEKIPGKAKVKGDSKKNDTVPKALDAGGVVVKRSVALDHDDRKAIDFVKAVMAKSGMKK